MTTHWLWKNDEGEVWGLSLNLDTQRVEWADALGCACGGSFAEQSFADFLASGPRYGSPPQPILDEVIGTLSSLQSR
jgi:hypothetical protein